MKTSMNIRPYPCGFQTQKHRKEPPGASKPCPHTLLDTLSSPCPLSLIYCPHVVLASCLVICTRLSSLRYRLCCFGVSVGLDCPPLWDHFGVTRDTNLLCGPESLHPADGMQDMKPLGVETIRTPLSTHWGCVSRCHSLISLV